MTTYRRVPANTLYLAERAREVKLEREGRRLLRRIICPCCGEPGGLQSRFRPADVRSDVLQLFGSEIRCNGKMAPQGCAYGFDFAFLQRSSNRGRRRQIKYLHKPVFLGS